MKYEGKIKIKTLIAAGLLAFNLSGCNREIQGYKNIETQKTSNVDTQIEVEKFKECEQKLKEGFETHNLSLNAEDDELISDITIDGTDVNVKLENGNELSGTLYDLKISDITLENLYIYDLKYTDDIYNVNTKYKDYAEKGYKSAWEALVDDYEQHKKLELQLHNCSVFNEYKKGEIEDISYNGRGLDYTECRKIWLNREELEEYEFIEMPNLETLILVEPKLFLLDEETISICSNTVKNIIIDGQIGVDYIDKFDFTACPKLERVSIVGDSQETDLDGLKGLKNLKELAFGVPPYRYDINRLIDKDFQARIDLISTPLSSDDSSLAYGHNCIISDISAINGTNIEMLNISFLECISSDMLLETVKSLPNLKKIVGFEVNNAGMCSDELIKYCNEHGIQHPFTERSLEVKHKIEEIVSDTITEDMSEEEKIKALSEYIVNHMEYDYDLTGNVEGKAEDIKKGWGESLYYSVIEGKGVCQGYSTYAQNLFNEAHIKAYRSEGYAHTWNLVQIGDEYYFVDLTNIDGLIGEQQSVSFDDYNLEPYYLVPVEDSEESFNAYMLPIEAERQYYGGELRVERMGNYIIKVDMQNIAEKELSRFCGMIGILSALGLAKRTKKDKRIEEKNEGIKIHSLKELLKVLRREQKVEQLKRKRKEFKEARDQNIEIKKLEEKINQKTVKETNIK